MRMNAPSMFERARRDRSNPNANFGVAPGMMSSTSMMNFPQQQSRGAGFSPPRRKPKGRGFASLRPPKMMSMDGGNSSNSGSYRMNSPYM